ncbi:MAG: hypothetical protein ACPGXL_10450, partial [Chitinophagales bacterium]
IYILLNNMPLKIIYKQVYYLIHDSINKNRICSDELKGFLVDIPQLIEGPNISFASKFTLSYARRLGIFIEGGTLQDKLEKDIQIAELWLQHPNAIAAEPLNFIASYKQLLLGSLILHKQSIFDKYFKIFNYLSDKNKLKTNSSINIQFAFFRLKYNLQILSYSLKENFLAIWQLSKSYRKALPKYATHSNKTIYFVDLVNFLKMGLLSEQYEELIVLTLDLLYKWQVGKFKPRVYATIICAMLLSMYECKQKHLYNEIQKQKRKMEEHGTYDTVPKYIVSLLRKLMSKKRIGNGHLIYKHYHALIQDAFLQMTHVKKMNYDYLEVWLKMKIKATQPAGNVMG